MPSAASSATIGPKLANSDSPGDVATDSEGNVWVLDTGHNRVQKFDSEGDIHSPVRQHRFGQRSVLQSPQGIAVDSEDDVWVVSGGGRVQEFSAEGVFMQSWSALGEFLTFSGGGISVDPEGNVWVAMFGFHKELKIIPSVKKFTSGGELILEFGTAGSENSQFSNPQGIAADFEGNVLVADTGNNRIQEFDSTGTFVRKYGSEGTGNGQFKSPSDVAVDSEGRVWVIDTGNNRAQRFSAEGVYQTQFGMGGSNFSELNGPKGIAVDAEGNISIADTQNDAVTGWTGC